MKKKNFSKHVFMFLTQNKNLLSKAVKNRFGLIFFSFPSLVGASRPLKREGRRIFFGRDALLLYAP